MDPKFLVLLDTLIAASERVSTLLPVFQAMRAENRLQLTDSEWTVVLAADDTADARLEAAIATAKAEGR